jgi:hypothetical protein
MKKSTVVNSKNDYEYSDKFHQNFYVIITMLGIFLAVMENYDYLKFFGFMICATISLLTIFTKRYILKSQLMLSFLGLVILFLPMVYNSVECFYNYRSVIIFSLLKFIVALLMVTAISRQLLSRAIYYAVVLHSFFFLCHAVFLLFSMGSEWDKIIGLETSTNFILSLKRPTGLFDEPSLFGMTMMALLISAYILNLKKSRNFVLLLTLSVPVFSSFLAYLSVGLNNLKKQTRVLLVFFLVLTMALGSLVFLKRENSVKESPIMLRIVHLQYFFDSPKLFRGSGFCSAYGKFDRSMGRDELRSFGLGNFKDASQVLLMSDLLGPIPTVLFFIVLLSRLKFKVFFIVLIYFAVSKVVFFSFTGWFLIASCLGYQTDYPRRFDHYDHAMRWRNDYVE